MQATESAVEFRADWPENQASRINAEWLIRFHEGSRELFSELYQRRFSTVDGAVGQILSGADRETVVHEVFYRIMTRREVRLGFQGGSLHAWLATLARNQAIDFQRRRRREQPVGTGPECFELGAPAASFEPRVEARLLLARFRETKLPRKWERVFEARFVRQLEQQEAAHELAMHRTTLAYQEYRIRRLLQRFVLGADGA